MLTVWFCWWTDH